MSIEELKQNIDKLDNALYKTMAGLSTVKKQVDDNERDTKKLEKLIKDQDKLITKLVKIVESLRASLSAQSKRNAHTNTDLNDIRNLIGGKKK